MNEDAMNDDGRGPARLISVHFPKAGGTSLQRQLLALLPGQVEVTYDNDPLTAAGAVRGPFPEGMRAVHGHFRPERYDNAGAFLCTFLREPVENLISIYYYWKTLSGSGHTILDRFRAEQPDIFGFAQYPAFADLMSGQYFGGFDMDRFDFIGFHDRRDQDLVRLGTLLALPLQPGVHANRTMASEARTSLVQDAVAMGRLADLLGADVRFYERVRGLW